MAVHYHLCGKEIDVQVHWAGSHYVTRFLDPDTGDELKRCSCGSPLYSALCEGDLKQQAPIGQPQ